MSPHPALRPTAQGPVLLVRVIPRSQPQGLAGWREDRLLVRLGAAPVDGAANKALLALLSAQLGVPRSRLRIVSGERARDKDILCEGCQLEALAAKLPEHRCT